MKKIFVLKGKSETGKTTKINQIAEWVINNYGCSNTIGLNISDYKQDTHGVLVVKNLLIGINSSGDNDTEVKKVDELSAEENLDIIICSCRTKGKGRKYLNDNYNHSKGWLKIFISVDEHPKTDLKKQASRDARILRELESWLTGLEKL